MDPAAVIRREVLVQRIVSRRENILLLHVGGRQAPTIILTAPKFPSAASLSSGSLDSNLLIPMAQTTPSRSAGAGASPASSPRLPSPPPQPEVQMAPTSPSSDVNATFHLDTSTKQDTGAARRIRPGTKAADMAAGPPLVPLHELDTPFPFQEHLKALYTHYTHDRETGRTIPVSKEIAMKLATPPMLNGEPVDKNLWLYELNRLLCTLINRLIIAFFSDNPPCSAQTCPEMRASEWQYLCAVHEPPKSCCAIDYCCHTLDWAGNVLTSSKHFSSRLTLSGDSGNVYQSLRQLTNVFRRVYRIFAHGWFQHREKFWEVESSLGLYLFFKTVCDVYQLIPEDNYTIPPEAEGERDDSQEEPLEMKAKSMQILRKDAPANDSLATPQSGIPDPATEAANTTVATGATTRRHKHTPSTGVSVAPIAEGQEEDEEELPRLPKKSPSPPKIDLPQPPTALEHGAPEDPTPKNLDTQDLNPLDIAAAQEAKSPSGARKDVVMSPSGGSLRTAAGGDVLNAILNHMDDDDEEQGSPTLSRSSTVTQIPVADHEEEEDAETMEKIEVPTPAKEGEAVEDDEAKEDGDQVKEATGGDATEEQVKKETLAAGGEVEAETEAEVKAEAEDKEEATKTESAAEEA